MLKVRIREEDRIATLTKATKHFRCCICEEYIIPKTKYYSITLGGSGLGSIKYPDRCHVEHLPAYFEKVKRSSEILRRKL